MTLSQLPLHNSVIYPASSRFDPLYSGSRRHNRSNPQNKRRRSLCVDEIYGKMFPHDPTTPKSYELGLSDPLSEPLDPDSPQSERLRYFPVDRILPPQTVRDGRNWVTVKVMGHHWIKIRRDGVMSMEAANLQMLREKTADMPIQMVFKDELTTDEIQCTWLSQVRGRPLLCEWDNLEPSDKRLVAQQVGAAVAKLRELTDPCAMRLGGEPLFNGHLFRTRGTGYGIPHGPMSTDDEVWAEMVPGLGRRAATEGPRLRAMMPPCGPFTFTHGGLTMDNIMVCGSQLVAITGWEYAGFFPVWWEYVALQRSGISADDAGTRMAIEWRDLLAAEIDTHHDALEFWQEYNFQCFEPEY